MTQGTQLMRIGALTDGDCFFWMDEKQRKQRELSILAIDEFRQSMGMERLTPAEYYAYSTAASSGYVVVAVVRETGERCVRRLSDGKYLIWYDSAAIVQWSADQRAFDRRVEEMREAQKKMEQEQQRMNKPRSKKANRALAENDK